MSRRHMSRAAAVAATVELVVGVVVWAGAGPAGATSCSQGLSPDFALSQTVTPASGGASSYDFVVTNNGTCGATNVDLVVQFGTAGTYSFRAVQRSWNCVQSGTRVDCSLQSSLDQKSTQSSGNAGTAEVVVTGPPPASGTKNNPPNVTEGAFVDDFPQVVDGQSGHGPYDADDAIWTGAINPKTGGTVTTGFTALEPTVSHTVTIPAGVSGNVTLSEKALDATCSTPSPVVPSCRSDVLVNAPAISNGYKTIVIQVNGTTPPATPAFDEGQGPTLMLPCKGKTASPPCVASINGFNQTSTDPNKPPYFLVTIHDSDGSHIWS